MGDNLEQLFKTALEQVTVEPPVGMWERIDSCIMVKKRKQKYLPLYSSIAAAVALLLGLFFLFERQTVYPLTTLAVATEPILSHAKTPDVHLTLKESLVDSKYTSKAIINKSYTPLSPCTIHSRLENNYLQDAEHPDGKLKNMDIRKGFIPFTSKQAIVNHQNYMKILAESEDIPKQQKEKKNRSQFDYSIGGYIAPGYSSGNYKIKQSETRSMNYSKDQMSGLFNLSGGLYFAVKPHKRIAIETGIGYSRLGQKTSHAQVYTSRHVNLKTFQTTKTTRPQVILVTTPLGKIKNKPGLMMYNTGDGSMVKNNPSEQGSLKQQFDMIEIPLAVRYYINDHKIKFSLSGGIGFNFTISNQTFLKYRGVTEKMGEIEGIRSFNLNTQIGLGVQYPISKMIHVKIEPGFRYYLQSLSKNPEIDFKPYAFTFATGIGINF